MGTGGRQIVLFALAKCIVEAFSTCRLWIATDAIVETNLKKLIPVLVANHSRPTYKPFYTTFSDRFNIETVGIEIAGKAISCILHTQATSLCALI